MIFKKNISNFKIKRSLIDLVLLIFFMMIMVIFVIGEEYGFIPHNPLGFRIHYIPEVVGFFLSGKIFYNLIKDKLLFLIEILFPFSFYIYNFYILTGGIFVVNKVFLFLVFIFSLSMFIGNYYSDKTFYIDKWVKSNILRRII